MLVDSLNPRSNRVRVLEISPELLLELLKIYPETSTNLEFISDPIPVTAKSLRCGISEYGNVMMLVQDQSFLEVFEGQKIPKICPVYSVAPPDVDKF